MDSYVLLKSNQIKKIVNDDLKKAILYCTDINSDNNDTEIVSFNDIYCVDVDINLLKSKSIYKE